MGAIMTDIIERQIVRWLDESENIPENIIDSECDNVSVDSDIEEPQIDHHDIESKVSADEDATIHQLIPAPDATNEDLPQPERHLIPRDLGMDNITKWNMYLPNQNVRRRQRYIVLHPPGV